VGSRRSTRRASWTRLVQDAVAETWDDELEQEVLAEEEEQREQLQAFVDQFNSGTSEP
jgi:dsDNA-binding SOS-regulon protein